MKCRTINDRMFLWRCNQVTSVTNGEGYLTTRKICYVMDITLTKNTNTSNTFYLTYQTSIIMIAMITDRRTCTFTKIFVSQASTLLNFWIDYFHRISWLFLKSCQLYQPRKIRTAVSCLAPSYWTKLQNVLIKSTWLR